MQVFAGKYLSRKAAPADEREVRLAYETESNAKPDRGISDSLATCRMVSFVRTFFICLMVTGRRDQYSDVSVPLGLLLLTRRSALIEVT